MTLVENYYPRLKMDTTVETPVNPVQVVNEISPPVEKKNSYDVGVRGETNQKDLQYPLLDLHLASVIHAFIQRSLNQTNINRPKIPTPSDEIHKSLTKPSPHLLEFLNTVYKGVASMEVDQPTARSSERSKGEGMGTDVYMQLEFLGSDCAAELRKQLPRGLDWIFFTEMTAGTGAEREKYIEVANRDPSLQDMSVRLGYNSLAELAIRLSSEGMKQIPVLNKHGQKLMISRDQLIKVDKPLAESLDQSGMEYLTFMRSLLGYHVDVKEYGHKTSQETIFNLLFGGARSRADFVGVYAPPGSYEAEVIARLQHLYQEEASVHQYHGNLHRLNPEVAIAWGELIIDWCSKNPVSRVVLGEIKTQTVNDTKVLMETGEEVDEPQLLETLETGEKVRSGWESGGEIPESYLDDLGATMRSFGYNLSVFMSKYGDEIETRLFARRHRFTDAEFQSKLNALSRAKNLANTSNGVPHSWMGLAYGRLFKHIDLAIISAKAQFTKKAFRQVFDKEGKFLHTDNYFVLDREAVAQERTGFGCRVANTIEKERLYQIAQDLHRKSILDRWANKGVQMEIDHKTGKMVKYDYGDDPGLGLNLN